MELSSRVTFHTAHLMILPGNPTQHAGTSSLFHKKDEDVSKNSRIPKGMVYNGKTH